VVTSQIVPHYECQSETLCFMSTPDVAATE
jgi:hypothetical protein